MKKLFISYSHQDASEYAGQLAAQLEKTFSSDLIVIFDKRDLSDHQSILYFEQVSAKKADFIVSFISERYLKSLHCMYELCSAYAGGVEEQFGERLFVLLPSPISDMKAVFGRTIEDWEKMTEDTRPLIEINALRRVKNEVSEVLSIVQNRLLSPIPGGNQANLTDILREKLKSLPSNTEALKYKCDRNDQRGTLKYLATSDKRLHFIAVHGFNDNKLLWIVKEFVHSQQKDGVPTKFFDLCTLHQVVESELIANAVGNQVKKALSFNASASTVCVPFLVEAQSFDTRVKVDALRGGLEKAQKTLLEKMDPLKTVFVFILINETPPPFRLLRFLEFYQAKSIKNNLANGTRVLPRVPDVGKQDINNWLTYELEVNSIEAEKKTPEFRGLKRWQKIPMEEAELILNRLLKETSR